MIAIPGYQILNPIYNSSRTLVYRGVRLSDQKPVVIKLLRSEYPTITEIMQFRNQYTIAKNLNLPGITPILSLESYSKGLALVMEDRGFISLSDYLTENQLSFPQFLQVAIQISRILQGLHKNQIIHKDVKLQNILIHPDTLSVQLIDFSISSRLSPTLQELANSPGLEGTLAYMSPEQTGRMNCVVDCRSDLYSLGITFYQLLTGQLPFKSHDAMELIHCHLAKNPTPPQELNATIPGIINDIILKLMAKNPEDRYQSALGLRYDLERCLEQWEKQGKIMAFSLGKKDIIDRFIISDRLYGRATELEILRKTYEGICSKETSPISEFVLIHGGSGIGKSSLVRELYKELSHKKGYFISGKFDQLRNNQPFLAWSQAFQGLIENILAERTAQQDVLKQKILAELGEYYQVLLAVIPALKHLLGTSLEVTANRSVDQNQFNRIVKKFISIFADAEHPLVIFLDDVQWIDLESLRLIQFLMSPEPSGKTAQIPNFLLILAYRDQEVQNEHPLKVMLANLEKLGKRIQQIPLNPLSRFSVNQFIADTLQCSLEKALPLAEIVWNKTQGNPLFIIQLLKSFYEEGLIGFKAPDSEQVTINQDGGWQCDLARIKAKSVSQDVLDFLGNQVQKLPQDTQTVLKFASCLGNYFNLSTLALVCESTELDVAACLEPALEAGLVIPEREIYQFFGAINTEEISSEETTLLYPTHISNYQFIHDRIQQVSYLLIPPSEKPETHLKIGRLLFSYACQKERECSLENQTPETIFGIVNQFNLAIGLLKHPPERHELAQLNLIAGRKAKASTAYAAAIGHLAIGIGLLATESWQTEYNLTLSLYTEAVEVAYLSGYFDQMNDWI